MTKYDKVSLIVAIILSIIGAIVYPYLPDMVATHWNFQGEVDDTMPKFWGTFLLPFIVLLIFTGYQLYLHIDPLKKGIQESKQQAGRIIMSIILFVAYLYILMLAWNLGWVFDFTMWVVLGLGLFFYNVGSSMHGVKQNWTVGFKTPWTMSDPEVWDKTHMLAEKVFKAGGIVMLLGALIPSYAFVIFFITLIAIIFIPTIYSYKIYREKQ